MNRAIVRLLAADLKQAIDNALPSISSPTRRTEMAENPNTWPLPTARPPIEQPPNPPPYTTGSPPSGPAPPPGITPDKRDERFP
jgi:hypothetical protein